MNITDTLMQYSTSRIIDLESLQLWESGDLV